MITQAPCANYREVCKLKEAYLAKWGVNQLKLDYASVLREHKGDQYVSIK